VISLTENQMKAANESEKSLSVIASAGSGKTRVLTEHIRHLITNAGVAPHTILAFTFTEKGAGEIRSRLLKEKIVTLTEERALFVGTIHSFEANLLRQYGPRLGLDPAFDMSDEAESTIEREKQIRNFLFKKLGVLSKADGDPFTLSLLERFGFNRLEGILGRIARQPSLWSQSTEHPFLSTVGKFFQDCLHERIKKGKLQFDDLEILAIKLLNQYPDVRQKCIRRYHHILVDEFQDTSPLQASLIRELYHPGSNILFIVGDPQQSIYRFRKADAVIFSEISQLIEKNRGETLLLQETFRLAPELTRVVNKVFTPLGNFLPMTSHSSQETRVGKLEIVVLPKTFKGSAENQRLLEAKWTAQKIKGLNLTADQLKETALLFRSGLAMPLFRDELQKLGIPCQMTKTENLLETPIIRDLLHLLAYLAGDTSLITQVGILRSLFFNFSEIFIEEYIRQSPNHFFSHITLNLFTTEDDKQKWDQLQNHLKQWQALKNGLPPSILIRTILEKVGNDWINLFYVQQFFYLIDQIESLAPLTLEEFHDKMQSVKKGNVSLPLVHPPSDEGAIQLMTIHAAKGLEFKRVFLPQLDARTRNESIDFLVDSEKKLVFKDEDKSAGLKIRLVESEIFADLKEKEDEEKREESKRLLYVAMTRASDELYLILKEPKKESLDIQETSSWNQWLWFLLEDERKTAVQISEISDWSGLSEKLIHHLKEETLSPTPSYFSSRQVKEKPIYTVSALETFMRCEKEYELKYIQGIRAVNSSTDSSFSSASLPALQWGLLVHEVLQFLDLKEKANKVTVIEQAFFNQRIPDPQGKQHERIDQLMEILNKHPDIRSLFLEMREESTELPFMMDMGEFYLRGTWDRLAKMNESWMVLDYKTDQIRDQADLERRTKAYWGQMACYALAASHWAKTDNIKTALLFTDGPYLEVISWNSDNLDAARKILQETHTKIEQLENTSYPNDRQICLHCPYYPLNYCGVRGI